jgi:hypothetical protein
LRSDLEAVRHVSDGGGQAWLVEPAAANGRPQVRAGSRERFTILYEAGPHGVAEGGVVFLQASPFWGWDSPQVNSPDGPGYTRVDTDAPGIELRPYLQALQLLAIPITGRALKPGERIRITYGAGPARARVDRFAERESPIWIAVDGDGDGVRSLVPESPTVDVVAAEPARLLLTLPTTARPGERVRLVVAVVDDMANSGIPFAGEVVLRDVPGGLELPRRIVFKSHHQGRRTIGGVVRQEGVYRLRGTVTLEGLEAESNPLVVRQGAPPLLWGDLHGHSNLSDGSNTPEDYLTYARDVAGLDVVALTDHDHWGIRFLDSTPGMWEHIRASMSRFHEPGRFVTLLGYEWTSWLHGHRHVLYFAEEGEVLSSMDSRYQTPAQLWEALAGRPVLTFAHHSAGGPVATNWNFPPDPVLEPVTEIVSVHGSSEANDSPGLIYDPVYGNFVRDALDRGYRFGFIGSGGSHDGHPGLVQLASPAGVGGLAAIFSEEHTREGVLRALRTRHVYATNGPRIWLRVSVDGYRMGSTLATSDAAGEKQEPPPATQDLDFDVAAQAPIARIDIVRGGERGGDVMETLAGEGRRDWSARRTIPRLGRGEYLYLRVVQEDGGVAWSSPIYAD